VIYITRSCLSPTYSQPKRSRARLCQQVSTQLTHACTAYVLSTPPGSEVSINRNSVVLCLLCKQASAPKPHQHAHTPATKTTWSLSGAQDLSLRKEEQASWSRRNKPADQGEASQEKGVKQNSKRYQKEKELAARGTGPNHPAPPSSPQKLQKKVNHQSLRSRICSYWCISHSGKSKGGIQKNITPNYPSTRFPPRKTERWITLSLA
jgi:hypothetical protein